MEMLNGEQCKELLDAQAHIWSHMFNFINSMSLKCAVQLGIPDVIHKHGKPMTLCELVDVLAINEAKAHGVYRLMRILIHSGFFTEEKVYENEELRTGYCLTPASRLLLKDEPWSVMPLVLLPLDPTMIEPSHHLSEWFKNENITPFEATHGMTFWEYVEKEPRLNGIFNEAMASDTWFVTSVLMRDFKHVFEGLSSMVDVGGGTGTMSKVIANAFPNMKCTVLDLPHVVAGLEGTKNLSYVGGDMFESIPSADAVLLKWVLHNWSDGRCIEILKICKGAVSSPDKRGKVVIIDIIVNDKERDHEATETQLFFDLQMMVAPSTGRQRNEKEWAKIFDDAGFSDYKIISTLGLRSVIEVYA